MESRTIPRARSLRLVGRRLWLGHFTDRTNCQCDRSTWLDLDCSRLRRFLLCTVPLRGWTSDVSLRHFSIFVFTVAVRFYSFRHCRGLCRPLYRRPKAGQRCLSRFRSWQQPCSFSAKLSGLFAFAASVAAISLLDLWKRRQLTSSLLAMWAGCSSRRTANLRLLGCARSDAGEWRGIYHHMADCLISYRRRRILRISLHELLGTYIRPRLF